MTKECEHFTQEKKFLKIQKIVKNVKKNILPIVALRMCLTCGHVGCCDSSIGKHATKHFEETGHPDNASCSRLYLEMVLHS